MGVAAERERERLLSRATTVAKTDGLGELAVKIPPWAIQQIHEHLPSHGYVKLNGVTSCIPQRVGVRHLPEYLTQYVQTDDAFYEAQYIGCVREYVRPGDRVVLVGGGNGISTVAAARAAGESGEVVVYEAGEESVERTRRTARMNDVDDRVTVRHAVIGEEYSTRGDTTTAQFVTPSQLGACDVLAIDADGAELDILDALEAGPDCLVVEHHAVLEDGDVVIEYQPETVRDSLWRAGYRRVEEVADATAAYGRLEERILVAESE